jgi:hypothetical protein
LRRFFIAYIDVFIERRRAVVEGVEVTQIDDGTTDGRVVSDCKGESDDGKHLVFCSDKYFVRLEIDDNVDDEADGADFERSCKATLDVKEVFRRKWCGANKLLAIGGEHKGGVDDGDLYNGDDLFVLRCSNW